MLACRVAEPDSWCRRCGCEGAARDTVTRRLAHEPLGWRPTTLLVTLRRYRCTGCGHVWRKTSARPPSHGRGFRAAGCGGRWKASCVSTRIAEGLGVSWSTANSAVLDEGTSVPINDSGRFEGVKVIGVDEHAWHHTRRGDKFVTVIIDLTPVREGIGPARLLDMVQGRSKQVFKTWLEAQSAAFRGRIEVAAMDGFTGFKARHQRTTARRGRGDGPLPRRRPGRRRARPLPPTRAAGHLRAPRPLRRPALGHPPCPAHRRRPAHRPATTAAERRVRQ